MAVDQDLAYVALQNHSDVTRDVGVAVRKKAEEGLPIRKSASWHNLGTASLTASQISQPGGFRRLFVQQASSLESGAEDARKDGTAFVDQILHLHFQGFVGGIQEEGREMQPELETQGLLAPHLQATGWATVTRNIPTRAKHYESRPTHLVIMLVKSCIGITVLFLPRAMMNGGVLLVSATFLTVTMVEYIGVYLLVTSAEKFMDISGGNVPTYGELSVAAMGPLGGIIATISFGSTQLAFCAVYVIFITKNAKQLVQSLSSCVLLPNSIYIAAVASLLLIPLVLVRHIRHFACANLCGNLCIASSLVTVLAMLMWRLASADLPAQPIHWVKLDTYALALGTCICAFEGCIGSTLAMYEGTAPKIRPHFLSMFLYVMLAVGAVLISFGAVAYLALKGDTEPIVLLSLPSWPAEGGGITTIAQMLYILAIFCTYPMAMFSVVRPFERLILPESSRGNVAQKWKKNIFRISMVVLMTALGLACEDSLDNYVALIGGLCSTPVAIVYPAVIHASLVGGNRLVDFSIILVGCICMVFTTYQAIASWSTTSVPPCVMPM